MKPIPKVLFEKARKSDQYATQAVVETYTGGNMDYDTMVAALNKIIAEAGQ